MWCFCRKKRLQIVKDERDNEFVRIVCDNEAETNVAITPGSENINSEKTNLTTADDGDDRSAGENSCHNRLFETDEDGHKRKIHDYENVMVRNNLIAEQKIEGTSESPKRNDAGKKIKSNKTVARAEVHSPMKFDIFSEKNSNLSDGKNIRKRVTKGQHRRQDLQSVFSSHSTQTENGILPAPLMKRREKVKSSEMAESQNSARNYIAPIDLSSKPSESPEHEVTSKVESEAVKPSSGGAYHYENLPNGQEASREAGNLKRDSLIPLDLSIGGFNSSLDSCPLNLSKRNLAFSNVARLVCNGELPPNINGAQCFSTTSSKPDLLSNVDDDDCNFNDSSKIGYFNAVYDKALPSGYVPSHGTESGRGDFSFPSGIHTPSSLQSPGYYGSEPRERGMPQLAHSGSYVHQKGLFNQHLQHNSYQQQQQCYPGHQRFPPNSPRHLPPSHAQNYSSPNALPFLNPAQSRLRSCNSSLYSLSNQSVNNSYYNPSYQNYSLSKEVQYAVLDEGGPVYNNLLPSDNSVYQIYDDKTSSSAGPVYTNVSPKVENLYFAYDNNTYIPPRRSKRQENMYENENLSSDHVTQHNNHTYSTIGSNVNLSTIDQNSTTVPQTDSKTTSDASCDITKDVIHVGASCVNSEIPSSESVPAALNLVKTSDIPLPVKVKSSLNGRNFNKQSKNNGKNNKSSNNHSKFSGKFRSRIKDVSQIESPFFLDIHQIIGQDPQSPSSQLRQQQQSQTPQQKQKGEKQSLTSLSSDQQGTPEKIGPPLEVSGKKFSSLSDVKKNAAVSPSLASNTPKSKTTKSRGFLSSLSFKSDKKPVTQKKQEGSKVLDGRNRWGNSSAVSLGSIVSLASSSSSLSNYVHPPSVASEGGILSNYRGDFDNGSQYNWTPPCLAAHLHDTVLIENFKLLKECPWYWGALDVRGAEEVLSGRAEGSFIVRDSSDEGCIVSLSFRSLQATHHTRIEYKDGSLSFHVPPSQAPQSPSQSHKSSPQPSISSPPPSPTSFGNIIEFIAKAIEDSTQSCGNLSISNNSCWLYLERARPLGVARVPVKLFLPISKQSLNRGGVITLKNLARKFIVNVVKKSLLNSLPLPQLLKAYLLVEYITEGPIESI